MKNILFYVLLIASSTLLAQQKLIEGTVLVATGEPIANAVVGEKGTFNEVETNEEGKFEIELTTGNQLLVTAFLMEPKVVSVSEDGKPLQILLAPDVEMLEAVSIKNQKQETKYTTTAFGDRNRDAVGYGVDDYYTSFISPGDTDMFNVFRKMPGLVISGSTIPSQERQIMFLRAKTINGGPALVVLDGSPVDQSILNFINPNIVTKITILRGLSATVKYGSTGAYGVILIDTKNNIDFKEQKTTPPSLLVKGNDYDEEVPLLSEVSNNHSKAYLQPLQQAETADEALAIYQTLANKSNNQHVPFYIDVANEFSQYGNLYTHKVLSDLFSKAQNNPRVLKTIVFTLEEKGMLKQASFVLEQFIERYPKKIQLYRDLAKIYTQSGKYNLAANLYKQMIYNNIPDVDFTPIEDIVFNEFRNLIAHHKNKIDYSNIPNEFLIANYSKDVRIILEYTNSLAEFEVQFVSPKKKYYTWNHTWFDNKEVIESEIAKGYGLKEFIIEDSDYGDWTVNIKQVKNARIANPTYLKYTIYKNYGTPSETKETKVINLAEHNEKVTLDQFTYTASL